MALGEAGQTYSQQPHPVQRAASTTIRLVMFSESQAMSSAPYGHAPTQAPHSRLKLSRQWFSSTRASPIGRRCLFFCVKRGIAPLGQTWPHWVQDGGQ